MHSGGAIQPGATLGVFGGGQLGRMFMMAAARLGYRTLVFAPEAECPGSQVAGEHICAAYDNEHAVTKFVRSCDAVTIEFENVPVHCLEIAQRHTIARPGPELLAAAQDRLLERRLLDDHGLPTAPHASVTSPDELRWAVERIGAPGVLKSARFGYDGRGQARIDPETDLEGAWRSVGADRALYESWIEYAQEISVLVARGADAEIRVFGPIENHHANHVLDSSVVPARVSDDIANDACQIAKDLARATKLEGLICVELFVTGEGGLLINEIAPRPHNSGHLTIEACDVSQFEQQVRALCGLPLGAMTLRQPAAMKNLLGDLWSPTSPDWGAICEHPEMHLHLYGKPEAKPGRKMGHLTVLATTPGAALDGATDAVGRATNRMAGPCGGTQGESPAGSPTAHVVANPRAPRVAISA